MLPKITMYKHQDTLASIALVLGVLALGAWCLPLWAGVVLAVATPWVLVPAASVATHLVLKRWRARP